MADFELRLSNPSTIAQQQKLELIRSRFEIAGTAPEGSVSRTWIQKNVLGLTDEEIEEVQAGRIQDKIDDTEVENAQPPGGEDDAAAGGGGDDAGGGGDDAGGGLFAADQPEGSLLTAHPAELYDEDDDGSDEGDDDLMLSLSIDDDEAPIKAQNAIFNAFGEPVKIGVLRAADHKIPTHPTSPK